jgi:preprotein translocase subunit SecB
MEAHIHATTSPLQLNRYFLKRLFFGLNEDFDHGVQPTEEDVPPLYIGVVSADQNPEDPLQWRFEISVELGEPDEGQFPYKVEAVVVGYFTVSEDYPKDRAERMAKINGPALLYSSTRDLLRAITSRSPYPALLAPSMMFIPMDEDIEEPKQLTAAKKARATKSKTVTKTAKKRRSTKGTT